ncbi:MAG TPA: GNAT family N-acetyltransferase [Actinomycetota bacterium]|nr:GNAT family N-acetyltransferase [Actinomycetota bacterium]
MVVRDAVPADADAMGELHVLAWQHGYRGQLPDPFLDALSVSERRLQWRQRLSEDRPAERVLVVEEEGTVSALSVVGPSRDPDAEPGTGELMVINVHPARWGQGAGRTLLRACVAELRARGFARATLWVLVTNSRARRFYEADGWVPDGAEKVERRKGARLQEVRYVLDLGGDVDEP